MDCALTIFIYVWVCFFVLANVTVTAGQFYLHGFWGGLGWMQAIYNPWNVWNLLAEVAAFAPAIGAYQWRERRRDRIA